MGWLLSILRRLSKKLKFLPNGKATIALRFNSVKFCITMTKQAFTKLPEFKASSERP